MARYILKASKDSKIISKIETSQKEIKIVGHYDLGKYERKKESLRLPEYKAPKVIKHYGVVISENAQVEHLSTNFGAVLVQNGIMF